jgi:hypothetical protein
MGCNVSFFAFDELPDLPALEAISWLTAFRLFRRKGRAEWYLEGPSSDGDGITFFERLIADNSKLAAIGSLTAAVAKLGSDIKSLKKRSAGYDDEGLLQALALSLALKQRVLYVSGNDESLDCGFVCKDGAIVHGRLELDWNKAVAIEDGSIRVESLYPDGTDPDTAEPRRMYALASQEATAFFRSATPWCISSDPHDVETEEYELVCGKGSAEPLHQGVEAELMAVWASSIKSGEKLRRYIAIIAPHINTALRTDLILAERQSRDPTEQQLLHCRTFVASLYRDHPPQLKALAALLSDLLSYLRLLRPRPRFRQNIDFAAVNQQLTRRWRILRMSIAIRSRLGL